MNLFGVQLWGSSSTEEVQKDHTQLEQTHTDNEKEPQVIEVPKSTSKNKAKKKRAKENKANRLAQERVKQNKSEKGEKSIESAETLPPKESLQVAMAFFDEQNSKSKEMVEFHDSFLAKFELFSYQTEQTEKKQEFFSPKDLRRFEYDKMMWDKNFDTSQKEALTFRADLKKTRATYWESALPQAQAEKRGKYAQEIWKYHQHFQFYKGFVKLEGCIVEPKKRFAESIESHERILDTLEERIREHYQLNQKNMKELENTLKPKRNLLEEVVNIPSGQNDGSVPPYLCETISEKANEVFNTKEEDGYTFNDAVHTFVVLCPRYKGAIRKFLARIFEEVILDKSPMAFVYKDFAELFRMIELLNKEGAAFAEKLNDYLGEISKKNMQLQPQQEDKKKLEGQAEVLKARYGTLFREGDEILHKIQLRREQLRAVQKEVNQKFENAEDLYKEQRKLLKEQFTSLVHKLSNCMDDIKSKRMTVNTVKGYVFGQYRVRHPEDYETPFQEAYYEFFEKEFGLVLPKVSPPAKSSETDNVGEKAV